MTVPRNAYVILGVVCLVLVPTVAMAVTGYSLSGTSSIETPSQSVTYEGQEYTIDAISRISADDSITVDADVPTGSSYSIYLRGPDNQIISSEDATGDTSYTFSYFGSGEAGTYAATIQDEGSTMAVYPIVLAGYDVSVSSPGSVTAGNSTTITATVTERSIDRHSSLETVQVVVGNDDVQLQQDMTQSDDGTYTTTISTEDISPDTYNVYVVVRGDEEVRQRAEILGISDTAELTVSEQSTPTEAPTTDGDSTDDSGGNDGSSGGDNDGSNGGDNDDNTGGGDDDDKTSGGDDDSTSEPTSTTEDPTSPTAESPTSTTTSPTTTVTSSTTTSPTATETRQPTETAQPTTVPESETTGENVLAPSTSNRTALTTSADGPGFTALTAIISLLVVLGLIRRR